MTGNVYHFQVAHSADCLGGTPNFIAKYGSPLQSAPATTVDGASTVRGSGAPRQNDWSSPT